MTIFKRSIDDLDVIAIDIEQWGCTLEVTWMVCDDLFPSRLSQLSREHWRLSTLTSKTRKSWHPCDHRNQNRNCKMAPRSRQDGLTKTWQFWILGLFWDKISQNLKHCRRTSWQRLEVRCRGGFALTTWPQFWKDFPTFISPNCEIERLRFRKYAVFSTFVVEHLCKHHFLLLSILFDFHGSFWPHLSVSTRFLLTC